MIGMDAVEWLKLWERTVPGPARRRRRELLASAGLPGGLPAERLEVGRANAQLLRLHEAMFGSRLSCFVVCPQCDEALELELDVEELLAREPAHAAEPVRLQVGEWEVCFRQPTEGDLDAVQDVTDRAAARDMLLERCVTECRRGAEAASIALAPPEVAEHIGVRMEEGDPLATLDFELRCATCGHAWTSALEVDEFLWARLNVWVRRLLHEVHTLAKVYGWSERTIAAMSPWKRQIYLDLVEG
jgi:hypothetical protein